MNRFLTNYAVKNDSLGLGRTYVAVNTQHQRIDGYYTLSAGTVTFDTLPPEPKLPKYPIPTVHMGRLAVHLETQGQHLGEALLFDALKRADRTSKELGILAVELWALTPRAKSFYLKYGFRELADDEMHLYMAMSTVSTLITATSSAVPAKRS